MVPILVIARATPLANTSAAAITVNKRTTRRIQSAPFPTPPTGAVALKVTKARGRRYFREFLFHALRE